jgi:pilus assembly protein Flp/PilA
MAPAEIALASWEFHHPARFKGAATRGGINRMTSLQFFVTWMRAHVKDDRGASLVEYALLVALIAVVCIAAITLLGNNASDKFSTVAGSIGN